MQERHPHNLQGARNQSNRAPPDARHARRLPRLWPASGLARIRAARQGRASYGRPPVPAAPTLAHHATQVLRRAALLRTSARLAPRPDRVPAPLPCGGIAVCGELAARVRPGRRRAAHDCRSAQPRRSRCGRSTPATWPALPPRHCAPCRPHGVPLVHARERARPCPRP